MMTTVELHQAPPRVLRSNGLHIHAFCPPFPMRTTPVPSPSAADKIDIPPHAAMAQGSMSLSHVSMLLASPDWALAALAYLGVVTDTAANAENVPVMSTPQSRVRVVVEPTNEEWVVAHHMLACAQGD